MPEALPLLEIGVLLVALLAIALAQQINNIIGAAANLVRGIPAIGGSIAGAMDSMASGIAYVLGKAEAGVDAAIGASWHALARLTDGLWKQIEGAALGYLHLAELVARLVYAHSGLRVIVHRVEAVVHGIEHGVKTLEREWHGIEHRVKILERKFVGIDQTAIGQRLGKIEREIATVESQTIPAIQAAESDAATAISNLYDWIKGKASVLGVGTFTTAVAAALASLGFSWLSCKENPFSSSKDPCGLWTVLGRVLGLAAFLTVAFDFRAFVDASEQVSTFIGTAVGDFEGAFPLSLPPLPPPGE